MYYVDTSVLIAFYCPEALSEKAEAYIRGHDQPVISNLTEIEICSALSRKVREGGIDRRDAGNVFSTFLSHLNSGYYIKIAVESHHYKLARDWISQFNTSLRTLDALHLAVAFSKELSIITADKSLSESAKTLSVDVTAL